MKLFDYLDRFAMPKRCGDCAFTDGTDAHEKSGIVAHLCVESAEPFYCHRRNDAGQLEPRPNAAGDDAILCRGFVDAMAARGSRPEWAEAVAAECLKIWNEAAASGRDVSAEEVNARVLAAGSAAELTS